MPRTDITIFKDGDDLCVIFRNASEDVEDLIRKLLDPEIVSSPMLKPIRYEEPPLPASMRGDFIFQNGDYEGMTCKEAIDAGKTKAMAYLFYYAENADLPQSAKDEIRSCAGMCLSERIAAIGDPDEYAERLSDTQKEMFLEHFRVLINRYGDEIVQDLAVDSYDRFWGSEEYRTTAVAELIKKAKRNYPDIL